MLKLPPKCKCGKITVKRVTKGGKQKISYEKGVKRRGKKNLTTRKPQKKCKQLGLARLSV